MPADPGAEWTLYRDWSNESGVLTSESIETTRGVDGRFCGPESSWVNVVFTDIPLDGAAASEWIDAQHKGPTRRFCRPCEQAVLGFAISHRWADALTAA